MKAAKTWRYSVIFAVLGCAIPSLSSPYPDWQIVNNGKLIVDATEDLGGNDDISYPSVVEVPLWVDNKAHPTARYYLYFGEHHGLSIRMKWAPTIEGPWTSFSSSETSIGVLDFEADSFRSDAAGEDWKHIAAPDILLDHENKVFIMAFHGKIVGEPIILSNSEKYFFRHTNYVAFSKDGLNFNDPETGGGQPGVWGPVGYELPFGPLEQHFVNTSKGNVSVTTKVNSSYARFIEIRGKLYCFHSYGYISRPTNDSSPWHFASNAYESNEPLWEKQSNSDALWNSGDSEIERYKTELGDYFVYESHIATWLASSRFLMHPNNPSQTLPLGPYTVSSARSFSKVNHIAVHVLNDSIVEAFIYIRNDTNDTYPVDDPFNQLMRLELSVSSDDWDEWKVTNIDGVDVFDVVLTPREVKKAVENANLGTSIDPTNYGDPLSMGVPGIAETEHGKYAFLGFKSAQLQPESAHSEGQIMSIRLTGDGLVSVDAPMELSFSDFPEFFVPSIPFTVVVSVTDDDGVKWVRLTIDDTNQERKRTADSGSEYSFSVTLRDTDRHDIGLRARDDTGRRYVGNIMKISPRFAEIVSPNNGAEVVADELFRVLVRAVDPTEIKRVQLLVRSGGQIVQVLETETPNEEGFYELDVVVSAGDYSLRARYRAAVVVRSQSIKVAAK